MKRTLLIILASLLLVSCKAEPSDTVDEKPSDTVSETVTQPEETETVTPNELPEEIDLKAMLPLYRSALEENLNKHDSAIWDMTVEERLAGFLDALVYQNVELVDVYTNGWGHDYSGVSMTYELGEIEEAEWDGCKAIAKIKVSTSNNPTFPVGEHEYEVTANYLPDPAFIQIRKAGADLEDNLPESNDPKLRDALVFSDRYLDWCLYETKESYDAEKIFEIIKLDAYEQLVIKLDGFTLEEFEAYMTERFGAEPGSYPEITEGMQAYYNEEKGRYVYSYGQCATTYACRVSGVDKTENGYKIHYEFYSDMAYLQKCMDVTLTFEENEGIDLMRIADVERIATINVPRASYNA